MSEHSIREYLKVLESGGGLVDFFYPVGSYYETSNTAFDPNVAWSGTWILEDEGLVHIGAGQTYSVGDTGGEAAHVLTPSETATKNHSHTLPNHTHGMSDNLYYLTMNYETVNSGAGETQVATSSSSKKYALTNSNSNVDFAAKQTTANPNSNPSTGGNPADADATSAHNNMQPYVVVNRWHRTE